MHVAHERCSDLLGWRCDMLCTSDFVADDMFLHNGSIFYGTSCVFLRGDKIYDKHNCRDSNQILLNNKDRQLLRRL